MKNRVRRRLDMDKIRRRVRGKTARRALRRASREYDRAVRINNSFVAARYAAARR